MNVLPIQLLAQSTPKVKVGEKIKKGQILAQVVVSDNEAIHLSPYEIAPDKFSSSLKKHLGDAISSGEVVAIKRKLIGRVKVYSPISGTLVKIDEQNQDLYLKPKDFKETTDILSPVDGVIEFCDNTKILIKTTHEAIPLLDVLGSSIEGELLKVDAIDKKVEGKIVIRETFDRLSVFKSFGLGAIALMTKKLEDFDFLDIDKNFEKTIAIVSDQDYKNLNKMSGKNAYIDSNSKFIL